MSAPTITLTKAIRIAAVRLRAAAEAGAERGEMGYYERALVKAVADRIVRAAPLTPEEQATIEKVRATVVRRRERFAAWQKRYVPLCSGDETTGADTKEGKVGDA